MHFVPFDGFYLFFRYNDKEKVMVVLNKNNGEAVLKTDRLSEMLTGCSGASEIITGKTYSALSELTLPGKSISVFELH